MRKVIWICAGFSCLSVVSAIVAVAVVLLPVQERTHDSPAIAPAAAITPEVPKLPRDLECASLKIGPDREGRFAVVDAASIRLCDRLGDPVFEVEVGSDGAPLMNFWGPSRPRRMGPEINLA